MRIGIIGLGSIGSRRARLLAGFPQVDTLILYDPDQGRVADFVLNVDAPITNAEGFQALVPAADLDGLLELKPDAVLICTPAETHVEVAMECLAAGIRGVFIEKPLSVSMEGISELQAAAKDAVVMVACNMRWAYAGLRGHCEDIKPARVFFHSDKPLAAWREGAEVYRGNGIMLESAIHELDVAYSLAGAITSMTGPTTDNWFCLNLTHQNGARSGVGGSWGERACTMRCACLLDAASNTLATMDANTADTMYEREMQHFLACVENNEQPCNTIADASHVLSWALRAKEMAA